MKHNLVKRSLSVLLVCVMALSMLAVTASAKGDDNAFTWWIYKTDGEGLYYDKYEDSPIMQYLAQQTFNGKNLEFSFIVPIAGSESDNFNTMMATGEYPEVIALNPGSGYTPQSMYDDGTALDLTEYVEQYMPNYLAYLEANPIVKPFVTAQVDGETRYLAIYSINEGVPDPWCGTCYRRDWVVKFCQPTEYVWDWESETVKANGHPDVTPLAEAVAQNNLNGWKANEITAFEVTNADPMAYADNVIFPSGTADPLTISDWEWMFEGFEKAPSYKYCYSVPSMGFSTLGDLGSSFGGGNGAYYINTDGEVVFDGDSENFGVYLQAMQNWYNKGWLDQSFNERAGDMFFMIDTASVYQGQVGMWCGLMSTLGAAIRPTCADAADQADAFVLGAALPINDVYGTDANKHIAPDAHYQDSRVGSPVVLTDKAEKKDIATLLTFFDWTYTNEGMAVMRLGLTAEQYAATTFTKDLYAEQNLTNGTYISTDNGDGTITYKLIYDSSVLAAAVCGQRVDVGLKPGRGASITVDKGYPAYLVNALDNWTKYEDVGGTLNLQSLLDPDETALFSKTQTAVTEYQAINVPAVIKGTMSYEDYVNGVNGQDPDCVLETFNKYAALAK